jgi:four helix bundle protein
MPQRQSIESYRDLEVWQRGVTLVKTVYDLTEPFPASKKYGLTSQLRRASVSIPSNIAEGWGYSSRDQYHHYLERARSSLLEVETQIIVADQLGYISSEEKKSTLNETTVESKMLLSLMRALRS